jgi:hypothetical protein
MFIFLDNGFVFDKDDMRLVEEEVKRVLNDVCPDTAAEWNNPRHREELLDHIIEDHDLQHILHPHDFSLFVNYVEVAHIWKQMKHGENAVGLIYQRNGVGW